MNFRKSLLACSLGILVSNGWAAVDFKEAEITTIKNIVEHDSGTGAAPAKVNEKIQEKSKVSTSAASMAELTFADASITRMGANTQFSFQSKERLVKLDQGTVLVHTPPGNGGATVDCGGVTGAVSGTTFMASRDVSGNTMFVLLEGQGGLKVSVGGSSVVIRPGQAASVGADAVREAKNASTDTGSKTPGPSAGPSEEKKSAGPGGPGTAATASGEDGGTTPSSAAPKIQVFEVDVKKVVTTSPLIVEFKNELPSAAKIENTVEVQQKAVQEGKLEKLDVEIVAVKSKDGDVLVGAPQVEQEEMMVVNRKADAVGIGGGGAGDNLDVDTAAGPGAGTGGGMAGAPAPRAETPVPAPPAASTPPVNPGQTALQPPPPATKVAVTARVNDASRPFGQDNPSFGFNITTGSLLAGHSLVTDFLTAATRTSGVSASPFVVNFSNPRIVDSSGADVSSRYDLTTLAGVLNVVKAGQSVTFGSVGSLTFGQSVDLVASALGGEVGFEVVSGSASVVNGKLVANSGTGTVDIRAVTLGNDNYLGASAVQTITLAKADQSVSFTLPSTLTFDASTGLSATALDSGTVSFTVLSGPGTIDGSGKLVATSGTGSVVVRATAAGDGNYNGAFQDRTITLAKAGQSVSFALPPSLTFDTTTGLGATVTGAGSVSYELVNAADASKVSISGGQLKALSGTGTVQVRAVTAGNDNYDVASAVETITLAKANQSVSFKLPSSLTFNDTTGLSATALDSGTVSFSVLSGPGKIDVSGNLVATSGTGSVVVRATAAGDSNYNGAFQDQTITLAKANQVLNFGTVPARLTGSAASLPVFGVQAGSPTFSILETDGRATIDTGGVVTVGKILGADSFTIRATAIGNDNFLAAQKDSTVSINRNVTAIEAANPTRQLLYPPDSTEQAVLDEFFYFNGKAAGYAGGPDRFFSNPGVGDTDRTLAAAGVSTQLYSGQSWDFFVARKFTADPGLVAMTPSAGKTETVTYGNSIDLGAADPRWEGTVDPSTLDTSLGYRYLTLNGVYDPGFLAVIDSVRQEPYGYFDPSGSYYFPLKNFPVWDDEGGFVSATDLVQVKLNGLSNWMLVAGSGGIAARGLDVEANGSSVQMQTSGDLDLKTTRISGISPVAGGESLTLEARGKVRLGTDATVDLNMDTNAGLAEQQQVRLEAQTDAVSGAPLAGNLAVIRTGDSLELRNVTIRGFNETTLEKLNPSTKVREGRVLVSGSAVRDFKIKELVGAAVNADAKIQMMALDGTGALAGDMLVEGKMPVQAKIATALAEAGEVLPSETANAMVDAKQIDLAARNLKFDNANLVAMNSITARANTILVQNSFMTVVRNQGMINMYVQSGLVNTSYGTQTAGRVNFDGVNKFQIGNNYFEIGNQAQLSAAYGTNLIDITQNGGTPQVGKVNVLKL